MNLSRTLSVGLLSLILTLIPAAACGGGGQTSAAVSNMPCIGEGRPLYMSNHMPYTQVKLEGRRGWFVVDTGTNRSGYSKSWLGETNPVGTRVPRDTLQFFDTQQQGIVFRVDEYDHDTGDVTQVGMVGTDVLARHPTTFDYDGGTLYQSRSGFCDDAALRRAGLFPVPIKSNSNMTYDPAPNGKRNVPMIEIEVNDIRVLAQIDTGLSDGWDRNTTLSLNVNEAFVKRLRDEGYSIEFLGDEVSLTTCKVGSLDKIRTFRIVGGSFVNVVDSGGRRHPVSDVTWTLKSGTKDCGGLNAWPEPTVQIGASWFEAWGVFAFDPVTKRMWVPDM